VKHLFAVVVVAAAGLLPADAFAQSAGAQIQGFGGLTMRSFSPATTFGGNVAVPIGDHAQLLVEGGRLTDITSSTLASVLDFTPVDLRLSAIYGQAGVRLMGSSDSAIRPYVEVNGGFARVRPEFTGIGPRPDAVINVALTFLDRTKPIVGGGGGVMVQGGPLVVDLGYRYTNILAGDVVQTALAGGRLDVHQFRLGIGVKF
jgi:opacity protein-like surface antigen